MKKILFLLFTTSILSCASYPEEPPYLIGEEDFTMEKVKKEAPYRHSNDVPRKNGYSLYNLPSKIYRKEWDIIEKKYKADLFYMINKKDSDIYRNITKWHANKEKKVLPITYLFKLLKAEGVNQKDCTVVRQNVWKEMQIRYVLLLYKGVKHQVTLGDTYMKVKSYPEIQQPYWESQGKFMMDTPLEIEDKWHEAH
ncbi:hypothetical protein CXF68_02770 [Tenacibaculum sp. Bg11-29]|uniref:hypothetical protein n=1 Tax=Tenacibaculum sp. Bg11-29 TaxID=2058306 RepID=UPI000C3294CD|nr:hypothetical protein [Tenacibaculum sp. Bg11-29]PKH49681.1 hypothetical protein CXF68_02770 [Tenacibaculum sp. Bg11-29]